MPTGVAIRRFHHCSQDVLASFPSAHPFRDYRCLVAQAGTEIVGFLCYRELAGDESEILQLETASSHRRRGIARALLRELRKNLSGTIFLEVRESNLAARRLYESEGFAPIATRQSYYSDPSEGAIVLRLKLC